MIFVFDAGGKLASEYQVSASQSQSPTTSYLTNDTLGSPRIVTDSTGNVTSRRDFMPYGEEIPRANQGTDKVRQKFTGYERDNETNLDYAKARMYGFSSGRFTSPDNFLNATRPQNPASWNLYVYALNNPLRFIDPNGEIERDANGNVIFHKTGEDTIYYKNEKLKDKDGKDVKIAVMKNGKEVKENAYVRISWKADLGYVKANDGTEIQASKATTDLKVEISDRKGNVFQTETEAAQKKYEGAGSDNTSDCHGTTFASGQVWINDPEVEKLMVGDGYRQVKGSELVQKGDVGIYSSDGSLSTTHHSVTFNKDYTVTSKGGITKLNPNAQMGPGTAWENEKDKVTVWTQRAKPKN